jgi:hypothetical protein
MVPWDGSTSLEANCNTQINIGWHAQGAVKGNYFSQAFDGTDFTSYSSIMLSQASFDASKTFGTQWWVGCSSPLAAYSQSAITSGNIGSQSVNYAATAGTATSATSAANLN